MPLNLYTFAEQQLKKKKKTESINKYIPAPNRLNAQVATPFNVIVKRLQENLPHSILIQFLEKKNKAILLLNSRFFFFSFVRNMILIYL